jgi:hypothetical protein
VKRLPLLISAVAIFATCAACGKTVQIHVRFNPSDAEYIRQTGSNAIDVYSFVNQIEGTTILCPALHVELWPVNDYTKSLAREMVGSENGGEYAFYHQIRDLSISKSEEFKRFREYVRLMPCNPQGHAIFTDVPDGEFYLYVHLSWTESVFNLINTDIIESGTYNLKRISLQGGESIEHTASHTLDKKTFNNNRRLLGAFGKDF